MAIADLSVSKTASPNPVGVGQPLTYTLTIRNNGPDTATTATLKDTLPSDIYLSDITVLSGANDYCYKDGIVTWNVGVMNPGDEFTMEIIVIPKSAGILVNTAFVYHANAVDDDPTNDDIDPNPDNDSATVEVEVTGLVDLIICKDSCPVNAFVGQQVDYTVTVLNNGPSIATGVIVTDELPAGVTVVPPLPSGCSQSGNIITCNLGTMNPNDKITKTITVIPNVTGPLVNKVQVDSNEEDSNPSNNEAEVTTNVAPAADVSITKTVSANTVKPFEDFTYTLTVTNNGPSTATNVIVTDTLPSTVNVLSIVAPPGTIIGGVFPTLTFTLASLAPGATVDITINVEGTDEGMLNNSATVVASEEDPNPCNNSDSVCTFVTRSVSIDISVEKTHSPEPAGICSPVLYTITVTNLGDVSATGVTLVDQFPSTLEIISVNSSQGKCCICGDKGGQHSACCGNNDRCREDCHNDFCRHDEWHQDGCCRQRAWPCGSGCYPASPCAPINYPGYPCHAYNSPGCCRPPYPNPCPGHPGYEGHHKEELCHKEDCQRNICNRIKEITCQLGALAPGASAVVEVLARPKMLGTITNTAIVTANELDTNTDNNVAMDTLTVVSACDQLDGLIAMVNDMITSGDIEERYGQILIDILSNAKRALCCSSIPGTVCCKNTHGAECDLVNFINKVKMFIEKGIIDEENGCELIRAAEPIIEALRCMDSCWTEKCVKM